MADEVKMEHRASWQERASIHPQEHINNPARPYDRKMWYKGWRRIGVEVLRKRTEDTRYSCVIRPDVTSEGKYELLANGHLIACSHELDFLVDNYEALVKRYAV